MTEEEKIHHRCSTVDSNVGHRSYGSAISSSILVGIEPRRDSPSNNIPNKIFFKLEGQDQQTLSLSQSIRLNFHFSKLQKITLKLVATHMRGSCLKTP